ncbi:hypothetical protein AAZX31_18G169100 [Glycine max]|uniref:C2H2-type domain-containing protein n=2 Tax=Glycine subgen. Soja TaxID=1462606 RepID=I1N2L1_SOYBN|nr:uncharacterized protein LOC100527901 [Glycine max]XP_028212212.1 uncharacterized protein LOC114394733 [Glycine soja]KAG5092120.1 hypothetical protein JHK82_050898 [Glycine max]KAG5095205.1 hypothetical protein JHK84_050793 [Glycine max]KAH1155082.1 hypothetical protein GYH30_050399 [Glycine max]KHN30636.1 Transcriptional regulator TAC1 [Glycine soja]KHN44532.1 Transcriptional regulator TAC1 [Glycine soja]|eukprot:NP_001235396.2 uncharacterized protein LOC100527901 [Glycine max]
MSYCNFPFALQTKMEFNSQNPKKSEIRWSPDNQGGPGQGKSYSCYFCKRGFSNAQALGGHMNIHRKDRAAKLKQSSEENLLSLDISIKATSDHPNDPSDFEEKILFRLGAGEEKHPRNHKYPFNFFPRKDDHHDHAPQIPHLPSFVLGQMVEEKKAELDLELRLGLHPRESATLNTRSFF